MCDRGIPRVATSSKKTVSAGDGWLVRGQFSLRDAFKKKDEERKEFFLRQKCAINKPGVKRKWDLTQYEQFTEKKTGHELRTRVLWQPFMEWKTQFDFDADLAEVEVSERNRILEARWAELIQNPAVGTREVNGMTCIPKFVGLIEDAVAYNMTGNRLSRSVRIDDPATLSGYQQQASDQNSASLRAL